MAIRLFASSCHNQQGLLLLILLFLVRRTRKDASTLMSQSINRRSFVCTLRRNSVDDGDTHRPIIFLRRPCRTCLIIRWARNNVLILHERLSLMDRSSRHRKNIVHLPWHTMFYILNINCTMYMKICTGHLHIIRLVMMALLKPSCLSFWPLSLITVLYTHPDDFICMCDDNHRRRLFE